MQNRDFGVEDVSKYNVDMVLEVTNATHGDDFVRARNRWMQVITGDLPSNQSSSIPAELKYPCTNNPSAIIDDLVICGRVVQIDGTPEKPIDGKNGTILGQGGALWIQQNPITGKWMPVTGSMTMDIADIDRLIANSRLEGLVLHEMGHVFGIGGQWKRNSIVDENLNYIGQNAIRVWKNDWGCVTNAPPVEKDGDPGGGTRGVHWDEKCLKNELMTGYAPFGPLSRLTIATLNDLGYTVNYAAADPYDGRNTSSDVSDCCFPPSFNMNPDDGAATETSTPPLSSAGRAAAVEYGLSVLKENELPSYLIEVDDGLQYVGDRFVTVYYEENGNIYDVHVTNE